MPFQKRTPLKAYSKIRWFELLMALVALTNLGLVLFDLSYVNWRNLYLRGDLYQRQLKANSQNSDKDKYLKKVDELKAELEQKGLQSPGVEPLLQELRNLSTKLLDQSIFRVKDQYGSLEEIKKRIRAHIGAEDAKKAFQTFWSSNYLAQKSWPQELYFFDSQIRFLMEFYEPKLFYDPLKGIEPNRDTQKYLLKVDELKVQLKRNGLQSPRIDALLDELRGLSKDMISNDPFKRVNKSGSLEEIKNRIRRHIYSRDRNEAPKGPPIIIGIVDYFAPELFWAYKSSTGAFNKFWSRENLVQQGWEKELDFFDRDIRFLIQSNYYRHIREDSEYIDRFWLIDLPFIGLFLAEFLVRTRLMSRRKDGVTWLSAMQQRWYDLFLVIPFWQWLRVIPVTIRLQQAGVLNLDRIREQIGIRFIANFAEELTQVVVINVIGQLQGTVERGDLTRALFAPPQKQKAYIDINDTNEVQAIASRLLQITVCKVLPEIQQDLEAVLHHQVEKAIKNSPAIGRIQRIPGLGSFPTQLAERLVTQVSKMVTEGPQNAYNSATSAPPDPLAQKLSEQLVAHFSKAMRSELQQQQTIEELESLLCDLLEEIKLNYVKGAAKAPHEKIVVETHQLLQIAQER